MKVQLHLTALAAMTPIVMSQTSGVCPLNCAEGSQCVMGQANYSAQPTNSDGSPFSFLTEVSRQGYYCDCPEGFTGIRCGRPYVICPNTDHYCYHGGTCIPGLEQNVTSDQLFCECSTAQYNGVPYVGKYCENAAAVKCDNAGNYFCVNNGVCKTDYANYPNPCNCPEGYRGPHCEFVVGQTPACDLKCQNGGTCKLGIKSYDIAVYAEFWSDNENYMHCECPDGWFGDLCQVEGNACGNAHCFNGASCVETVDIYNVTHHTCDCQTANTNSSFAGQYCQSETTTFCTQSGSAFCLNGGTCLTDG